jgi:glycosyltransferase involved in cell wall biosynthesis
VAPGFADERIFAPGPKERIIACIPRKRRMEYEVIRHMFARLRPAGPVWEWQVLDGVSEREVAQAMSRAAVFLSLNRFEGMSLTAVEAMASGCIVAGFTGIGPREYMNSVNGFWAGEDDCEACAEALVRAVALAEEGAGGAALMRHAGQATAHQWSYANFLSALEAFWRGRLA